MLGPMAVDPQAELDVFLQIQAVQGGCEQFSCDIPLAASSPECIHRIRGVEHEENSGHLLCVGGRGGLRHGVSRSASEEEGFQNKEAKKKKAARAGHQ